MAGLFATIGVLASVFALGAALFFLLMPMGDPLDRTRVVAVYPAPSGREAAVLYLRHIANFSVDVLAVKLSRPPFDAVGASTDSVRNIAVVTHPRISNWQSADGFQKLLAVSWRAGPPESLEVCPAVDATLVRFDSEYEIGANGRIALCQKAQQ